ncbi:MAG: MATE family efflux transporter [Bacteroidales bacterium]|nr:MATE family efflux transporter [Bacteroidales bacterium]
MSIKISDLTKGNVLPTLLKLAFPLMGTSFLQMAYTLMAMAWVGRLENNADHYEAAIGGIGMLLWLSTSIAYLSMIGVEVSVGHSIGKNKMGQARIFASHATTLAVIIGLFWALLLFIGATSFLSFFKLDTYTTKEAALFLRMVVFILPLQFLSYNFTGIYNGAGRSSIPFKNNALGLILNMILDPLFMFGFNMGFHGAALGMIISQLFVFSLFYYQIKIKGSIIGNFPFFIRLKKPYLKRIFYLGTPVSAMNSLFAVINLTLARIASVYGGHLGLMSQTTGGQIEGITWNTSQGFSTALTAFVAQNYAAKKMERSVKAYKYTLRILGFLGIIVSLAFVFYGKQIFGLIVPHKEAMEAGAQYLLIVGMVQVFQMLEVTSQGMFNGIGRTIEPAVVSIFFNLLRIPLAIYLATTMGSIVGVWCAIAISTFCKGSILPLRFFYVYRKMKKNISY